jgi:DNA repair protein RecN (Recombination protein N)
VLAHSLDLLMGGRARPQIVRPGADEAWVEGVFALPDGLLDDPELSEVAERLPERSDEIVLGRRVGVSGRTSAFVGGRSASAADLQALGSRLVAFYGQHEHRRLTLASAQLEVLDGFAGAKHLGARAEYRRAHARVLEIERELAELREREGARERDLDLLRFELAEIEAANPDPNEAEELEAERGRLRHAEGLRAASGSALAALAGEADDGGGARSLVAEAEAALGAVEGVDGDLDSVAERVRGLVVELDDLAAALRSYADGIDAEPGRLEALEERLAALDRLKRKHGGSIEAVLEHAELSRERIDRLENAEQLACKLESAHAQGAAERAKLAKRLSKGRREAAEKLSERVALELAELAMEGAALEVELTPHPDGFGASGVETVEFQVATNPGMPISPLRDATSGGELSRIMLALTGLGAGKGAQTLVLDEIDAGVGGNTARAVGQRLRELAKGRQVLCITHLPQVASLADSHYTISKSAAGGDALATVERVSGEALVAEIVRMLGGERGDRAASRHARELLKAA